MTDKRQSSYRYLDRHGRCRDLAMTASVIGASFKLATAPYDTLGDIPGSRLERRSYIRQPFIRNPVSSGKALPQKTTFHQQPCRAWKGAYGQSAGRRPHCQQHGFTLLEIMVVVALIVLTVSLVGINLGRDLDQVAELEARRFAKLVEHVRDESILTGRIYAVEIDEAKKSYQFFTAEGEWTPVTRDDVLRPRFFPDYLSIRFEVPEQAVATHGRLIIYGGVEITPFRLAVAGEKFWHEVSLDDSLNVRINRMKKDAT